MPTADGGAHEHRGTRAIQRMVEFSPSTGGLALWIRHRDLPADQRAPAVATDGSTLFYGAGFEKLKVKRQAGLVAHEVLHVALRHAQRFLELKQLQGDVDLKLYNICADAIVNSTLAHLTWLELPDDAVQLDRLLSIALSINQPVERSLLEWDVERLYRAIDDRRVAPPGGSKQDRHQEGAGKGSGKGGSGSPDSREAERDSSAAQLREDGPRAARTRALGNEAHQDLKPGLEQAVPPEKAAEEAREWSERILRAHAGDGAHSMLRALIADVPRTRTPWEQVLRTQLARALAPKLGISWSRPARSYIANQGRAGPNRRLPWTPGLSSSKSVPRLAVIVDVSGSIEDALLKRFAAEIEAIARRLEAGLVLVIGDDQVRRVAEFEPGQADLQGIEFRGGGGTDFTPLLLEADKHRPDIAVVLTDLDGPAHFRPRWPVIWAVPEASANALQPFGRKLGLV